MAYVTTWTLFFGLMLFQHTAASSTTHSTSRSTKSVHSTKQPTAKHTECSCVCFNTTIQSTTKIFEKSTSHLSTDSTLDPSTAPNFTSEPRTTSTAKPESCNDVCDDVIKGTIQNQPIGIATRGSPAEIFPDFLSEQGIRVYCDCTHGTGEAWTVFQRRIDGSVDFFLYWNDYVNGFGNVNGEFWLGLDWINRFTGNGGYKLRVDLEDWDGNTAYAEYSSFSIGNSDTDYTLMVGGYNGTAGDSLHEPGNPVNIANMIPFSTQDRDNDNAGNSCAQYWEGAWWFNFCFGAHLNGRYKSEGPTQFARGVIWSNWLGYYYSLKGAEMKFRRN